MESWKEGLHCNLSADIYEALEKLQFCKPTPVQAATIPLFAKNKDVVVEAVTGSGKTLAFLIPILEILGSRKESFKPHEVGAVVISPTRELAKQIGEALEPFLEITESRRFTKLVTIGGNDPSEDVARFKAEGGNILIGTPGRLEDLLSKHPEVFGLKSTEVLVLDEADRLLDMGFERSLGNIIERLPKQRRTGLFSATMTNAVNELVRTGLRNPVRVTVKVESKNNEEQKIPESLKIFYHCNNYSERLGFLLNYLKNQTPNGKSIVYFGTCACVEYFAKATRELCKNLQIGLDILALHGKMEHKRRERVYQEFVHSGSAVLFSTDLAARGLDFPDISLVVQFDAPQDPASVVHRCGRTARIGREGTALLLLDRNEEAFVDFLEAKKVPIHPLPEANQISLSSPSTLSQLIKINSEDRELYEKSLQAFVSYIRFYQEHHAKFIFAFKDLNIGDLARSFGLLHLPRMPELKLFKNIQFTPVDIDIATIRFKDKVREKQRQANIKKKALQQQIQSTLSRPRAKMESVPWSNQLVRKEKRQERREKKVRKREAIQKAKSAVTTNPNHVNDDDQDLDDIDEDYRTIKLEKRLGKRLKSGIISKKEFEEAVGERDFEMDQSD